jgi:hypothetical protein
MVIVIQFTYINSMENVYWGWILACIILYGPGRASVDYYLRFLGTSGSFNKNSLDKE